MIKNKKQSLIVIGVFTIILLLGTTTYAFFNYTRTGFANIIRTGRITFNSFQGTAINLTNLFPIDVSEGIPDDATKVGTVIINVTGDTTYGGGIEYLVSSANVFNTVGSNNNQKSLPISIDVSVVNNTNNDPATNLGTSDDDYYDNRGDTTSIYKVLAKNVIENNEELLVGYIAPGQTGVDGNIVIKAYLDASRIAISDTYPSSDKKYVVNPNMSNSQKNQCVNYITEIGYDEYLMPGESLEEFCDGTGTLDEYTILEWVEYNWFYDNELERLISDGIISYYTDGTTSEWVGDRTVFTTQEWNSLETNGVSFQVKVEANEGIWVMHRNSFLAMMKNNADTTAEINFNYNSSDTNGKGIYLLKGTESDQYPIYYYRGDIHNNNVVFGGFCWLIVRTTDTGGTKMVYNGIPDKAVNGNNVTYNCGVTRNIQNNIKTTESLYNYSGYYYADDYEIVSVKGNSPTYKLKAGTNGIHQVSITNATTAASEIPTIAANYPYTCGKTSATATCTVLYKVDSYKNNTDAYVYSSLDGQVAGKSAFNSSNTSVSDVGYMYNKRYEEKINGMSNNNVYYGTSVEYGEYDESNPGVNVYRLQNNGNGSITQSLDSTHHYSCNETSVTGTCNKVRYYYEGNTNYGYYIELDNGETIEDALYKMTGNGDTIIKNRNSNYNLNENDSTIKIAIEDWFKTNLTNELDLSKTNYQEYIEDTIYCNDRSFKTVEGESSIPVFSNSGWVSNGVSQGKLYFGSRNRVYNNYYSINNVPSLTCPNETDRFSVSNNKAKLKYPVGLLTLDEIILSGVNGDRIGNDEYYLYFGQKNDDDFTMTPNYYDISTAYLFAMSDSGVDDASTNDLLYYRPVISLKVGTIFEKNGNGTPTNPYVVKYN